MNLLNMDINEELVIDSIETKDKALKERMLSLGLWPHAEISIVRFGLFKSTIMIAAGGTWIGLRKNEATIIDVHKI